MEAGVKEEVEQEKMVHLSGAVLKGSSGRPTSPENSRTFSSQAQKA